LEKLLTSPERSVKCAIDLTFHAHTLMIMLPVLVDKMVAKRDVPKDLRQRWMEQSVELKRKLHNSVGHVLQVSVVL
jgi:hypothetical protein